MQAQEWQLQEAKAVPATSVFNLGGQQCEDDVAEDRADDSCIREDACLEKVNSPRQHTQKQATHNQRGAGKQANNVQQAARSNSKQAAAGCVTQQSAGRQLAADDKKPVVQGNSKSAQHAEAKKTGERFPCHMPVRCEKRGQQKDLESAADLAGEASAAVAAAVQGQSASDVSSSVCDLEVDRQNMLLCHGVFHVICVCVRVHLCIYVLLTYNMVYPSVQSKIISQ